MKRFSAIAAAVSICGLVCIVALTLSFYYYNLYRNARTRLEEKVDGLEGRVNYFARAHQFQDLVPCRINGRMVTAAIPTVGNSAKHFGVIHTKSGPAINDRLYLAAGSAEKQEFTIQTEEEYGRYPVDAWLLHVDPPDALTAFREFGVYCTNRELRIVAQPGTNAAIDMHFTLVLLRGLE